MPLKKAACSSKKCMNAAVSANIKELKASGTRPRSQKQIVAIAFSGARGGKSKKK